jgi:hypothetical protein
MKLAGIITLLFVVAVGRTFAQQSGSTPAAPQINAGSVGYDTPAPPIVIPDPSSAPSDKISGKHLVVQGPLVQPFKAKSFWDAPRRLLHSINPFAKKEHVEEIENPRDMNPHAWTTMVGWSPGRSAFADPVTHESSMGLVSLSGR